MKSNDFPGDVANMQGQTLDYWMYCYAAKILDKKPNQSEFEKGYDTGLYHFCSDKALLFDLMEKYDIRLQMLGREWLASTESHSQFGLNPIEAACRLVVAQAFS